MSRSGFVETKKKLEDLLTLLKCVSCSKLPRQDEVFHLTECGHKFCPDCIGVGTNEGLCCPVCNTYFDDFTTQLDFLSGQLVEKLKTFEDILYQNFPNENLKSGLPDEIPLDVFSLESIKDSTDGGTAKVEETKKVSNKPKRKKTTLNQSNSVVSGDEFSTPSIFRTLGRIPKASTIVSGNSAASFEETETSGLGIITTTVYDAPTTVSLEGNFETPPKLSTPEKVFRIEREELPILTPYGPEDSKEEHPKERRSSRRTTLTFKAAARAKSPRMSNTRKLEAKKSPATPQGRSKLNHLHETPKRSTNISIRFRSLIKNYSDFANVRSTPTSSKTSSRCSSITGSSVMSTSAATSSAVSSPKSAERRNTLGETSLHIAAKHGNVDRVKKLIGEGLNVNAKDNAGWSPLHEAVNAKTPKTIKVEMVTILCENRAHVSEPGYEGETPLHEAARNGDAEIVTILLHYGANRNIRNKAGELASNVAKTPEISLLIADFNGPVEQTSSEVFLEETPEEKYYFTYDVDSEILYKMEMEFGLQIVDDLSDATHIVFNSEVIQQEKLMLDYLMGMLQGAWLIHSTWIKNLQSQQGRRGDRKDPEGFEVTGRDMSIFSSVEFNAHFSGPLALLLETAGQRSRQNRQENNPGLFHGINFYLYKTCSYKTLSKKDLVKVIKAGDGVIINRDPNPDVVDPLENPTRFHADASHKMCLTSHVILYNENDCPSKIYTMEHVKTLRVEWLIESIVGFCLQDPDLFIKE